MPKFKRVIVVGVVVALSLGLSGCLGLMRPEPVDELAWLKSVEWVFEEDFSTYEAGAFPNANWVSYPSAQPERAETWSIVEFAQSESGYALQASDAGHDPNRLILAHDLPQARTGKIVLQTRMWLDNKGLQGVDLWDTEHSWENYASLHPWNSGWRDAFKDDVDMRAYDMVVLFDLQTRTIDIYVDGTLLTSGVAFRDKHEIPDEETYHLGLSFNAQDGSTPVYWETVRVGLVD